MDLIIEKDEHAAEVFEGQMGGATKILVDGLGISEEIARKLVVSGLMDLSMFNQVDADDLTEMLDGDRELAEQIVEKARQVSGAAAEAPSEQ